MDSVTVASPRASILAIDQSRLTASGRPTAAATPTVHPIARLNTTKSKTEYHRRRCLLIGLTLVVGIPTNGSRSNWTAYSAPGAVFDSASTQSEYAFVPTTIGSSGAFTWRNQLRGAPCLNRRATRE